MARKTDAEIMAEIATLLEDNLTGDITPADVRQVFEDITDSKMGEYTNSTPMPATVGGLEAGTTFDHALIEDILTGLLYAYQYPGFSSFSISGQSSPKEVGATIPAAVTFTWSTSNSGNVTPNSVAIRDVTGAVDLATGLDNDGSEAITMAGSITKIVAATHQFRISATNTHSGAFNRTLTFEWRWREYWGVNAGVTINEAAIKALDHNALNSGLAGAYALPALGYKYICFPDTLGWSINAIKDADSGFDVAMATVSDHADYSHQDAGGFYYALVSVTNANGITTNYRVYRTQNYLNGALNVNIT